jgi:hypothetical protein
MARNTGAAATQGMQNARAWAGPRIGQGARDAREWAAPRIERGVHDARRWAAPRIERGVHDARRWTAPRIERAAHAVEETVAPKVSSAMTATARRVDPSTSPAGKTSRRRLWIGLVAGAALASALGGIVAVIMRKRAATLACEAMPEDEMATAETEHAPEDGESAEQIMMEAEIGVNGRGTTP